MSIKKKKQKQKKQRCPPENSSRTRKGSKYFSSNLKKEYKPTTRNINSFSHYSFMYMYLIFIDFYLPILLLTVAPKPSGWGLARNFFTTGRDSLLLTLYICVSGILSPFSCSLLSNLLSKLQILIGDEIWKFLCLLYRGRVASGEEWKSR